VLLAARPPPGGGPAVGDAVPGTMQLAGPLVKHFTYDGLGRLVRVLSPYPESGATPPEGWTVAPVRSERLYYDGVRRIQEVYTDPLLALGESAALGDPEAQGEVSQGGEEEGQTLEGEEGQIESGSGEPGGEEPPGPPPNTFITYLEREYLWGPGDGITSGAGAGLDELVAIFDIDRRAWWTLLDVSGDVVAIVDDGASTAHGYGTGTPSTSTARLCAQFCYDAYGALFSIQGLHPYPDPRTGHKGLHLDRLDAGVANPLTGAAIARHEVGAEHAYFVRNRHYSPEVGRFLQRDPNATGQAVLGPVAPASSRAVRAPVLSHHLSDGVGVFLPYRGSPMLYRDPLGLDTSMSLPGLMGTMGQYSQLQATEAKTKGAVAGNLYANPLFWEQVAVGGTVALIALLNTHQGQEAVAWMNARGSEVAEFLRETLGMSYHAEALTSAMIGEQMSTEQIWQHGDPKNWTPKGKKDGGSVPGRILGDVKEYFKYIDAFKQHIEVHFFRDASGAIKRDSIKIRTPS
jgi:hypothetical protein